MSFKSFIPGEVLTAANVNEYFMKQVIPIFANATERSAQLTAPIEGQFCVLTDSDTLFYYNGSAWVTFASLLFTNPTFSGTVTVPTPTSSVAATTKAYVDNGDIGSNIYIYKNLGGF